MKENTASHPEAERADQSRVLVLEPSQEIASEIVSALREAAPAAHVEVARSLEEAQVLVLEAKPDLFVLDVDATYDLGQEFLYDLRTSHPNARAIILTAIHLAAQREQAQGLGAIHFLEKPFPRGDFVMLAQALLVPSSKSEGEKFQGTLSDLHIADIVQLKCMSGSTSVLEFTGPQGEKARIFFENGQVKHAVAPDKEGPDKEGMAAFNEIVNWKGGMISEVSGAPSTPRTIDVDWQLLLMEAVRKIDETNGVKRAADTRRGKSEGHAAYRILVVDDSPMLLSFVCEILSESNYQVESAATGEDGLQMSAANRPDLVLLDYVLPDMRGDEVSRRLFENPATKQIPVLYMSGLGGDLQATPEKSANVTGFLNKPFTSDTLLRTIRTYLPGAEVVGEHSDEVERLEASSFDKQMPEPAEPAESFGADERFAQPEADTVFPLANVAEATESEGERETFFSGKTNFFPLHWALRAIALEELSGTLRCLWDRAVVEMFTQDGGILLVTTRAQELYCPEAPIGLADVGTGEIARARQDQAATGRPMFVSLADRNVISHETALQLAQHYGQKLFARLWTANGMRFAFKQSAELPGYACDAPLQRELDQWALSSLRFIQYQDLANATTCDANSIPAFTRDGFARVQNLRLTAAEAQIASQFNGERSIVQIAKNLRLDLKFAHLTIFRFLTLEIVECWPPGSAVKQERRGLLERIRFGG